MNSLKEDALVDISDPSALPQLILSVSLFTLLIGWLVTFAYLALRPGAEQQAEWQEQTAPRSAIKVSVMQTLPVTPRVPSLSPITQPVPIVTVATEPAQEVVLDHSSR